MTDPRPSPGWYPVDEHTERFWNGEAWGKDSRPRQLPTEKPARAPGSSIALAAVLVAVGVGLFMSMQSASLLTGTGTQRAGAVIAVAAAVFAFVLKVPRWAKIVVTIAAALSVVSVVYLEVQLEERRQDIQEIFGATSHVSSPGTILYSAIPSVVPQAAGDLRGSA